jgi:superfamily II DNA or RNA helicase
VTEYADFLASKRRTVANLGPTIDPGDVNPILFPFQRDLVRWAVRKGRAALWADTGLGKTFMQVEWARLVGGRALILAPLAVAQQSIREAARLGVEVTYARHQGEATEGITITNYERLDRFTPSAFNAVVLDESSILKSFSGVTKRALVKGFADTPYRLCCTATPAPNDIEELCNHADFLGVMKPSEMRSTFFIADSRGEFMRYRLKRHARTAFYRWLASWAMAVKKPSDLGYPDDGYILPPLEEFVDEVASEWRPDGKLFALDLAGVVERSAARKATMADRIEMAASLIRNEPEESWLVWCGLNDEGRGLAKLIPGSVVVEGSDDPDDKASRLLDFADGTTRVLITKPSIAGFGLNFQRCARVIFLGLGDSFEAYYQAVRRVWRFGQTRPVHVHIVVSEIERTVVYENVLRKQAQAVDLSTSLIQHAAEYERAELFAGTSAADDFEPRQRMEVPPWMIA